jgi:hypothetical protein
MKKGELVISDSGLNTITAFRILKGKVYCFYNHKLEYTCKSIPEAYHIYRNVLKRYYSRNSDRIINREFTKL